MIIDIPFKSKWLHKMVVGTKTCTSRTKAYGKAEDRFRQFGHWFAILLIERQKLSYVAKYLYKEEGCDSPDEFKQIWCKLHPRKGWVDNQVVFVHFFRKEK